MWTVNNSLKEENKEQPEVTARNLEKMQESTFIISEMKMNGISDEWRQYREI